MLLAPGAHSRAADVSKNTITHQSHPNWGRHLEQYTSFYTIHHAKERIVQDAGSRFAALDAMKRICEYDSAASNSNPTGRVTIATLRCALSSTSDPEAISDFLQPQLISGCIALMSQIKLPGTELSPFSYEYGYLCFRILTIALGVCVLSRTDNLKMTVDNMIEDEQTEPLLLLSGHVARVIQDEITAAMGTRQCDWVLGWTVSKRRPPQNELVSRENARKILNLLWNDRTCFLKAFRATYSPGLTGVLFLLWRYVYLERTLGEHPNPDLLAAPLCEMHWRYLLVSTTDQDSPLVQIGNDLAELSEVWDKSPKVTSLEDSRTILDTFISRLEPTDTRLYAPLGPSVVPLLFRWLVPNMVPGSVDLLPPLIALTINRLWDALRNHEAPDDLFIRCIDLTFKHFILLFDYMRQHSKSSVKIGKQIIDAMVENDFLDFVGSMLLLLNPDAPEPSPEYETNYDFWSSTQELFVAVAEMVPEYYLEERFQNYANEWFRYQIYLIVLTECTRLASDPSSNYQRRHKHYLFCDGTWKTMATNLGMEKSLQLVQHPNHEACSYPRCPNPMGAANVIEGAVFGCAQCLVAPYCSKLCQAKDWVLFDDKEPHRKSCPKYAEAFAAGSRNPIATLKRLRRLGHNV